MQKCFKSKDSIQKTRKGRPQMKRIAWFGLLLLASGQGALAQQPADNLTDQQKLGRQVFAQSCGVRSSLSVRQKAAPPLRKNDCSGLVTTR
jgi:hypothetical protein